MRSAIRVLIFTLITCLCVFGQSQPDPPATPSGSPAPAGNSPAAAPTNTDSVAAPVPSAADTGAASTSPATDSKPSPATSASPATDATSGDRPSPATSVAPAQKPAVVEAPRTSAIAAERIFFQEGRLVEAMHHYTPMVETYIQNLRPDPDFVTVPGSDKYFLGRLTLNPKGIKGLSFKDHNRSSFMWQVAERLNGFFRMNYHQVGFMEMIFLNDRFDKDHYELKFLRRQFLGEVRTLVFDVLPKRKSEEPYFTGRIWVEDQDYNIVRFNGTYGPHDNKFYLHFDSWRINMQPGLWLPAYVYTEESDALYSPFQTIVMKGQTRLWAYDLKHSGQQSEFTDLQVDSKDAVDESGRSANEIQPLQSQHMWEREAEDNILDRLERAGVMAPDGDVSKVLQTVVNNLEITNNLNVDPEVRCRVLLTTPLESFTVGHTIVLSRGLLDTMPDEATLAMVLAQELGHIALGHRINTKYSFSDRMIFPDERVFWQIGLLQDDDDERAADLKGLELLKNSPYKDKLTTAGLYLRALEMRKHDVPWLISAHFGNRFTRSNLVHVTAMKGSPPLEDRNVAQLPALPLGSRIKLDPWDDHVEMQKGKQVALVSPRDKMSFEVTPMFPNLVRYNPTGNEAAKAGPGN
jgi:hypothetical protein